MHSEAGYCARERHCRADIDPRQCQTEKSPSELKSILDGGWRGHSSTVGKARNESMVELFEEFFMLPTQRGRKDEKSAASEV